LPTRDELVKAWGDSVLDKLPQRARSRFRMGRFLEVTDSKALFALPNSVHRDRCEEVRNEVEAVLREHFGRRIPLDLRVEPVEAEATASNSNADSVGAVGNDDIIDLSETFEGKPVKVASPEERLLQAFPGAEET
jgi:hypothetical protein